VSLADQHAALGNNRREKIINKTERDFEACKQVSEALLVLIPKQPVG